MGHCWSPFCGFNGGKGVATTVGVLLLLEPRVTIVCLPLYVVLRVFGRKMHWRQEGAIASLATMLLISLIVGTFAYVMLTIIFIRHIPNLREIMAARRGLRPAEQKSRSADAQAAPRQSR
jgi:glycerol-3-phosphate acyltransferase PlsY